MEITPKATFCKRDDAKTYADFVAGPLFKQACETAIAQFTLDTPRADTLEAGCRAHYETQGAKRFMSILLNLAEPEFKPPQRPLDNLCQPKADLPPPPKLRARPQPPHA